MRLIRVTTTYACGGIMVDNMGIVRDCAPIYRWARNKNWTVLRNSLIKQRKLVQWEEL